MSEHYEALKAHLSDIHNLNMAYWLLQWDMNTHMPPAGGQARAAHMATLQRVRHDLLTSDKTARLLEKASQEVDLDDFDSTEASMIRVAQADYEYAAQLSADFVSQMTTATGMGFDAWRRAKESNDFSAFAPALQRILELKLQEADIRGYEDHPYDVFLAHWERGLTTSQVAAIFEAQKPALVELVAAVNAAQDRVDDARLRQPFDTARQRELSLRVSTALGFDYDQWATFDTAPHPFCLQIAVDDIRLTTRFDREFFNPAFFATLHETGHGLHGRGFSRHIDGTFLSDMDVSSQSVAESQSRTWENLVGRSRAFWEWALPLAKDVFPAQFGGLTVDAMYRAVNKSRPQFIRVEADELTYNLHIMLRFEIELELASGQLRVADAPAAWNAKFEEFFGIIPPDDRTGILQDVHWSMGGIGAFVGYAMGNLLSVQYYNQALAAHPSIPDEIAQGRFDTLRGWLTENIYQHGRKYTADELTRRVTGESIQTHDYTTYLRQKFSDVYQL